MEQILPLLLLLFVMYFLLVRPQQQRVKAQRTLVSSLEVGDDVMTLGGVLGRIVTLDDEIATLETTPGTILRIRRSAIAGRWGAEPVRGGATETSAAQGSSSMDRLDDPDNGASRDSELDASLDPSPDADFGDEGQRQPDDLDRPRDRRPEEDGPR